jgi:hypothetical protein
VKKWSAFFIATMLAIVWVIPGGVGAATRSPRGRTRLVETQVTHKCTDAKVRPRRIIFACGDGNFFVKQLEWSKWQKKRARAHGHFRINDCTPNCAEGTFIKRKGRLTLLRRQWCENEDIFVYQKARIRYREPVEGRRRVSVNLFCPKN